jgi:predicted nucleic-acid-binding protein
VVAVDTNVLVRLVVADSPAQTARAAAVFRSGPVFIAKSVLLEAEWVLRYSYELGAEAILRSLRAVLGLENVSVEDPGTIATALRLLEQGLDFADALHISSSAHAERFVTFDAKLVKRARRASTLEVAVA